MGHAEVGLLPYLEDYTIIIQHWGIMVGLMGLAMMAAAVVSQWRVPTLVYSAIEKSCMVWLVPSNCRQSFVSGYWVRFTLDSTVVIYTVGYFLVLGFRGSEPGAPGTH